MSEFESCLRFLFGDRGYFILKSIVIIILLCSALWVAMRVLPYKIVIVNKSHIEKTNE
jgi:hypothetical protein